MVAAMFGVLFTPAAWGQTDATAVARGLIAAENANNVTAAVSFFAPGAIVNLPTGVFVGTAQITEWQSELAAGHFHADTTAPVAVTLEIVTFSGSVSLDLFRGLGLASLDSTWELTIQLGKFTTFNFNFTPAATARLGAALAGAGAPAAAGGGGAAAGGGGSAATPAASATAGRSLALTGSDLDMVAAAALGLLVMGIALAVAARRDPARR
jgi:hypothetical protein